MVANKIRWGRGGGSSNQVGVLRVDETVQISSKQFTIMFVQNILTEFGKIIGLNSKTRKLRKKRQ